MNKIQIVDYQPRHQAFFEAFNRAWIEEWFEMEPVDEWVLQNPDKAILDAGGAILMAEWAGTPAGTVALRWVSDDTVEFTKMAVDQAFRRRGIARQLSLASFVKAHALGARKIVLYSNTRNANAIQLYEQLGFRHLPVEAGVYARANVKMEIDMEEALQKVKENYSEILQPI